MSVTTPTTDTGRACCSRRCDLVARHGARSLALLVAAVWASGAPAARADEAAITVLTDFENASVAAEIAAVRNITVGECRVGRTAIPARGQGSLALELGATERNASIACDLTFREPLRFQQADRVATRCWINDGRVNVAFRVRDARGQLFETAAQSVESTRRWVLIAARLAPEALERVRGDGELSYPIEIQGYRVGTEQIGRQAVYLDDLQVEHQVRAQDLVRGGFEFDEPTRIYEPGSSVAAAVVVENRSHTKPLDLAVDVAWTRPDGSVLQTQRADINLPASGEDFRALRRLDFSQRIREPGLYRLVAQVRASSWAAAATFESSIAVTPSNRRVPRGRATFFGVRTNLLREPELDRLNEISVARDIGVNLLAIDAPWRLLEPKTGTYDLELVDAVVKAIGDDMAVLLCISDPPAWLPAEASARVEPLARLLGACAKRFGGRLTRYHVGADVVGDGTAALDAVRDVREALARTNTKVDVYPPAIPVTAETDAGALAKIIASQGTEPMLFETTGDSSLARQRLESLAARGGFKWRESHWWLHDAEPIVGAGHYADAEDVLRHYVAAASVGVGGVIWFDLRDDDVDPTKPEALRGLVRRDFSPKTSLLGYAATAGMLTGYRRAGAVPNTPAGFESALFLGVNRQVAVVLPRPNRILPAALGVVAGAPGEFSVLDFERRAYAVVAKPSATLIPTAPRPLFVTLTLKQADTEPRLTFARPAVRAPGTVFCGPDAAFQIEVDAPRALTNSYVQVRLPKDAPFESSLGSTALRAAAGETATQEVQLRPKAGREFRQSELTLRVSVEGDLTELPVVVRPLTGVQALPRGADVADSRFRVGQLSAAGKQRATAKATVHGAHTPEALRLAVVIEDDRLVPFQLGKRGEELGDQLLLGFARADSDAVAQVRIEPASDDARPVPLHATQHEFVEAWGCEVRSGKSGPRAILISIPAQAAGGRDFARGERLLLAVRYMDDDSDGFPPANLSWGGGLDDSHSAVEYNWLQLGE